MCLFPLRLWSPSYVCDGTLVALIWILWNRSPFLSPKSVHVVVQIRRKRGSPVKAPPHSRRRMTPPTPVHLLCEDQGRYEEEGRGWNARERTIIARSKQLLERSYSVKVRVEELEGFLVPEDVDVDFRQDF